VVYCCLRPFGDFDSGLWLEKWKCNDQLRVERTQPWGRVAERDLEMGELQLDQETVELAVLLLRWREHEQVLQHTLLSSRIFSAPMRSVVG